MCRAEWITLFLSCRCFGIATRLPAFSLVSPTLPNTTSRSKGGGHTQVFEHLHSLDFTYHVGRQTGGLGRAIDRGTRGINFILSSMIFNVVPTALEVLLVAGILAHKCGPPLAGLALATLVAYTWFTFTMTAWRTQFRVRMNKMDAKASTRAIDALLNYETVRSRPRGGGPAPLRRCGPGGVAEPGAARRRRRRVCLSARGH